MILNLVILLIFCVSKIYSDESEEGKYIDLLPEDEKREFLEKVARRILEEVESKDIVKKSGELSDAQLNKHSSYVSQVMKEEENDMMKKHENDTKLNKKDVRSDNSMVINQDKTESGGGIENGEGNGGGHLEHIDLTLRQGKASITEHETEKRSISDTLNASYKPILEESTPVVSFTVNEETTKHTLIYENTRQTEAVRTENKDNDGNVSIEITINSNNSKKQPELSSNQLKPISDLNIPVQVFYDNAQNNKENLKETTSNTQTTTEDVKQDGGEYIYQSREEDRKDETRKTVTVMENYEPKKCWSSEESLKTSTSASKITTTKIDYVTDESNRVVTMCDGKPIKFETTSHWIIIDPTDVTGAIYEERDISRSKKNNATGNDIDQKMIANGIITTTEASIPNSDTVDATLPKLDYVNSTQIDIPGDNTNSVKEEVKNATVVNINNVHENGTTEVISEIHTTTIEAITIATPAAQPENKDVQNIENKSLIYKKPEKLTILISTTKNRFEEIKLKSSSLSLSDAHTRQQEDLQKNLMELESKYNEHKIKELKVYEIPPGQPLFIKNKPNIPKDIPKISNQEIIQESPTENGEQPNYVPIYNYSPNNAYFNAYNRLGPNFEDEEANKNSGLINTNVLRIKADSSSISFESREKLKKSYYFYNSGNSIKKIRSKILLPPSMPKLKKKKYNPQIYLDDYTDTEENTYFRKEKLQKLHELQKKYTRNKHIYRCKQDKKSKKHKKGQSDAESLEVDGMYAKGTLKNHIDAVRNYLSKKNYFQFYESPSAIKQKKKDKKSRISKNPNKGNAQKKDKKEDLDKGKDKDWDKVKDKALDKIQAEGEKIKEKGADKINEAIDDVIGVDEDDNENKGGKKRNKLNRLLRVHGATRYGHSKPNKRPKTGTVNSFHKKPPKYGHGIDLDYYFGRTGPDVSSSSTEELSFSNSVESSLENGQVTIGKLGSIYYSKPREYYDYYRRNTENDPGNVENNNDQTQSTNQKPKKQSSSDTKSKFSMDDFNLVKNMSVAVDLVPNVLMMQKLVGLSERSGDNNHLNNYLTVLLDFIEIENKALLQYDWLGSTVDIQSALRKLIDLTEQLNEGDFNVHPADWELFKYVFYIFETVDLEVKHNTRKRLHGEIPQDRIKGTHRDKTREALKLLPKSPKHTGSMKLKRYEPYFSLRVQLKNYAKKVKEKKQLLNNVLVFQEFLKSVLDNLNDLHDAIKHIGMVSKYKTAKWFKNLKEIYLNKPRKKEALTVLLHLSMNRVVNLIEESARDGVEQSFVSYVRRRRNAPKIRRTKEELSFVLSILRDLEKLEN